MAAILPASGANQANRVGQYSEGVVGHYSHGRSGSLGLGSPAPMWLTSTPPANPLRYHNRNGLRLRALGAHTRYRESRTLRLDQCDYAFVAHRYPNSERTSDALFPQ